MLSFCAAQAQSLDLAASGPILNAVTWLQGTLLGNVATALAVIALGAPAQGVHSEPLEFLSTLYIEELRQFASPRLTWASTYPITR